MLHSLPNESEFEAKSSCQFFAKTFGANALPRNYFHMARLTVAYDTIQSCSAKTAKALPISNTTYEEYNGLHTDGADKKNFFFVHCKQHHTEAFSRQNILHKCFG